MLVIDALQQRLMKQLVLPPAQRRVFLRQLVERHRQADTVLSVAGHDRKRRIPLGNFGPDPPPAGSPPDAQPIARLHPLRLAHPVAIAPPCPRPPRRGRAPSPDNHHPPPCPCRRSRRPVRTPSSPVSRPAP